MINYAVAPSNFFVTMKLLLGMCMTRVLTDFVFFIKLKINVFTQMKNVFEIIQ